MPKRRRLAADESGGSSASARDEAETTKRRRRCLQFDSAEMCQELYEAMRSHRDDEGRLVCESFIRAPKRRNSADYYDVVSTPIDLLRIQQKLRTDEYEDMEQMTSDVELMISNAKLYYKKSSQPYKDACQLWDFYISTKSQLLNTLGSKIKEEYEENDNTAEDEASSNDASLSSAPQFSEDDNAYEELFSAVMTATDLDGRVLSTSVQLLPSRRRHPNYFKVVQEPMDLKMVATKIQRNHYDCLTELEQDLLLIVRNAKSYNAPGSQIYKDAVSLRRVITSKKIEIEHGRATGAKSSERISPRFGITTGVKGARRLAGGQRLSAITAALQYESEAEEMAQEGPEDGQQQQGAGAPEDEDEEDEEATGDGRDYANPLWQLYLCVRNHQSSKGYLMSEPFMRKPNRRAHPHYYKEIKNPISLSNIRSKIKNESYDGIEQLVDDLNNMFENAKRYNRADSRIYKDAVKLQKLMQSKAKEFQALEKEFESEEEDVGAQVRRRGRKSVVSTPASVATTKPVRRVTEVDPVARKKMKTMYKMLLEHADQDGRALITLFMEKPSKKDYPDYYQVIAEPIDMRMIEANIRQDRYLSEEALVSDFHLMFSNCRQYNEEDSQIYRDADALEKLLLDKVHGTVAAQETVPKPKVIAKKSKAKVSPVVTQKLLTLYETLRDYTDKGRKLSAIFVKLPSRTDYPDYYEVIKKPMDLQRIQSKMNGGHYESLEDMLADFALVFDNACKYNEPDSQIYKDALTLQRVALQTKAELSEDGDGIIPDVRPLVQELLTSLFTYVYNHQDEEGRCYIDSLAELSESRTSDSESKLLTLDVIKRNLDKGLYKRLDAFQEDMFEVFETARKMSRTDSQVFEDSVELQAYFIKMRDDLCKNGEVLLSPALRLTERDMLLSVESLRLEKLPKERSDDEERDKDLEAKTEKEQPSCQSNADSVDYREQTYHVGDFVYIEPREKGLEPHIIHIERLWKDESGEQWLYGCWFYRPNETFHLATRKFLEKEVFKSDNYNSAPMLQVLGKCCVLFVKDYFKNKPEGFADKDVYVCESRYSSRVKFFKKIKIWPALATQHVHLVPREASIVPIRVPSVFKERVERHHTDDDLDADDLAARDAIRRQKPNVVHPEVPPEAGCTFYEQYNLPFGSYKVGDCVYVRTENGRRLIARIDRMWDDETKGPFFHGPWFVTPQEISHPPTRLFHKQEVFLSSIDDTNPLLSVTGRCYVMELRDYVRCRPTEIQEQDIFVCDSRYLEAERQIRKITKGLKKFIYSDNVLEDEIYFFKKPIITPKMETNGGGIIHAIKSKVVPTSLEASPLVPKTSDAEMDDSNDGHAASVGSIETPIHGGGSGAILAKKKPIRRLVTGYILYAGEVRKSIITRNPDSSFGDISRMVGTEWRALPAETKAEYEERAQKVNEETAAHHDPLLGGATPPPPMENLLYECLWDRCDFQFESQQDLTDHLVAEPNGHVPQKYASQESDSGEFQCLWFNCQRVKKNVAPFQNMQRLIRHCREVHVKVAGKCVLPVERSKNFVAASQRIGSATSNIVSRSVTPVQGSMLMQQPQQRYPQQYTVAGSALSKPGGILQLSPATASTPVVVVASAANIICKPPDPLFVATPPKPNRLVHSEVYLKYIESLHPENKMVSNWDATLRATQETVLPPDAARLPLHWLGNGVGNHANALSALWALRDYMLGDALNIATTLY